MEGAQSPDDPFQATGLIVDTVTVSSNVGSQPCDSITHFNLRSLVSGSYQLGRQRQTHSHFDSMSTPYRTLTSVALAINLFCGFPPPSGHRISGLRFSLREC